MIFVTHAFPGAGVSGFSAWCQTLLLEIYPLSPSPPGGKSSPGQSRALHKNKHNTYV